MCGVAAVPDSAMLSVILGEPESAVAAAAACSAGVQGGLLPAAGGAPQVRRGCG